MKCRKCVDISDNMHKVRIIGIRSFIKEIETKSEVDEQPIYFGVGGGALN